jgi:hypothetical protein
MSNSMLRAQPTHHARRTLHALPTAFALALALACSGCSGPGLAPARHAQAAPGASAPAEALPAVTTSAHAGARWLDIGLQGAPGAAELSGRFLAHAPVHASRRVVQVEGRDADGLLLFEERVRAELEPRGTVRHRDREATFRLPLPSLAGVASLVVSVPAAAVKD